MSASTRSVLGLALASLGLVVSQLPQLVVAGLGVVPIGLGIWAQATTALANWRWMLPIAAVGAFVWALLAQPAELGSERWHTQTRRSYVDLWQQLDTAAERAALQVAAQVPPAGSEEDDQEELRRLFRTLDRAGAKDVTLLLVRSAGQVVAWAGPPLPIDPGSEGSSFAAALPARGGARTFVRPASVTMTTSRLIGGRAWQGWMVTTAHSFDSTRLPWRPQLNARWSVGEGGSPPGGVVVVDGGEWPDLWVSGDFSAAPSAAPLRVQWLLVGVLALACVAVLGASQKSSSDRWLGTIALFTVTLVPTALPPWILAVWLLVGFAGYGIGRVVTRKRLLEKRRTGVGGHLLIASTLAAAVGAAVATWAAGNAVIGESLGGTVRIAGLRPIAGGTWLLLALIAAVAWLFYRQRSDTRSEPSPATVQTGFLAVTALIAAVSVDRPVVVLIAGIVLLVQLRRHWTRVAPAAGALLATCLLAVVWTASERLTLARTVYASRNLVSAVPESEHSQLRRLIETSLNDRDVLSLSLGQSALGSIDALAFGLWQSSALNQAGLDSYLAVTSEGQLLSVYEAGLTPEALAGTPDTAVGRRSPQPTLAARPEHPETPRSGAAEVLFAGAYFADLEFGWRPGIGYRWHHELKLSPPAMVTRQDDDSGPALGAGPGLLANAFSVVSEDGVYRLILPPLGPLSSLERVAARIALGLCVALLLIGLARAGLVRERWLQRINALRTSYPRRLALTLGGLILVPLLLVDLAILTLHERGLRVEQERLEQAALNSARQAVYSSLDALPSNFAVVTALNDALLSSIASIVGRDVDLYWNSGLYATSRRNRFASGQLGARLPAPVYNDLVLGDRSRSRFAGPTGTGEAAVYALLDRFDTGTTGPSLILAVPVSGQVEELTQSARILRSRTLLIGFAVLLLGFWATARAVRGFSRPILEMIAGTERIAAGADSLGMELPQEQDLGRLAAAIDRMAADVSALQQRERIERDLVEQILANVTTGVVLVRGDGRISRTNPVAAAMLGLKQGARVPRDLKQSLRDLPIFHPDSETAAPTVETVAVEIADDTRLWQVARLPVESHTGQAWLWALEDVTEVVRGERLAAWAEMARIIAHEVKNPLTPIRLSAEHLRELFRGHGDDSRAAAVDRCTSNILTQVEDLREIADEFSVYSRIPEVRLEPFAVAVWLQEVVGSYELEGDDRSIELSHGLSPETEIHADRKLLTRVVRNLLENALRASGRQSVTMTARVASDGHVLDLRVLDRGPGVAEGDLDRIFEPYFSTHETGTGLGLPISRRIVEAHGGTIEARRRDAGGLEVIVTLPVRPDEGATG